MQLDDASIPYVTINTHQVLHSFTRLPFGVALAPVIFQTLMDKVLQGLQGVLCYIDDILVNGEDKASLFRLLEEVFARLRRHAFRLKQEKMSVPAIESGISGTSNFQRLRTTTSQ